jgi:AcrR family transcriptional regulator
LTMPKPTSDSVKRRFTAEERRRSVLAAARSLFARQGYPETTLDQIAAKAGISRPRVIQLFGSKRGIYETIAATAYESHPLDRDLAEPMARKDDMAVFEAFAGHILRHTMNREDREIFKILLYARLKEDRFHRVHFHEKDTLMMNRLADYVRERVEAGAFRSVLPELVIHAYQAMISNLAIYKNVMRRMEFVSIEELSRECARIFLEGISSQEGSSTGEKEGGRRVLP